MKIEINLNLDGVARFYRQKKGGKWYLCREVFENGELIIWRREPRPSEHVLEVEDYTS